MKNKIRSLSLIFIVMFMIIPISWNVNAEEKNKTKRAIYVVFDNSGSMYGKKDNLAWSQATYAIEVFASMMNFDNGDTMKIFPMHKVTIGEKSKELLSSVVVKSKDDIEKIHNMYTPKPEGTPYEQVNTSYKELYSLLKNKKADEGWQLILTDGIFDDDKYQKNFESDLTKKAKSSKNLYVQYLGIGENVKVIPRENSEIGLYSQKVATSKEVVSGLTEICNRVFKRNEYNYNIGEKLSFDIPLNKIIVFAQGKDVQIKSLKDKNGKEVTLSKKTDVSYSATKGAGLTDFVQHVSKDTSLKGQVAIFENEKPLQSGEYTLDVTGAIDTAVYYEPNISFKVSLLHNGKKVNKNTIEGGSYTIQSGFVSNENGKYIKSSKLLGTPKYNLVVNGKEESFDSKDLIQTKDMVVDGDNLKIDCNVKYLNNYTDSFSASYNICALDVELSQSKPMNLKSLDDKKNVLTTTVKKNKKELSKEQIDKTKITIKTYDEEGNKIDLKWKIEKGKQNSTWNLYPQYVNNDMYSTPTGNLKVIVDVSSQFNDIDFGTAKETQVQINDDRNIFDYVKHYWKKIVIYSLLFIILLGYFPGIKKRFSKNMKKNPKIKCSSEVLGTNDYETKGKFVITKWRRFVPYLPDIGTLNFSPKPNKKSFKLKAKSGSSMEILNTKAYAGDKNLKINGQSIPENYKGNYILSANSSLKVITPTYVYNCIPTMDSKKVKKRSKKRRR